MPSADAGNVALFHPQSPHGIDPRRLSRRQRKRYERNCDEPDRGRSQRQRVEPHAQFFDAFETANTGRKVGTEKATVGGFVRESANCTQAQVDDA
jgi:hypothetical protein